MKFAVWPLSTQHSESRRDPAAVSQTSSWQKQTTCGSCMNACNCVRMRRRNLPFLPPPNVRAGVSRINRIFRVHGILCPNLGRKSSSKAKGAIRTSENRNTTLFNAQCHQRRQRSAGTTHSQRNPCTPSRSVPLISL